MTIMCRIRRNKRGFAFIEMLVAVLIFALAFGALLSAFVMGRVSAIKVKHRMIAENLLRQRMEWVKEQGYAWIDANVVGIGNEKIEHPINPADGIGQDELLNHTRTTSVTKDADDNLTVTVTLNWDKRRWGNMGAAGTLANPDEVLVTIIGIP